MNKNGFIQMPLLVGLVLMAVALPLVALQTQKSQENRSAAAGKKCPVCRDDYVCNKSKGKCEPPKTTGNGEVGKCKETKCTALKLSGICTDEVCKGNCSNYHGTKRNCGNVMPTARATVRPTSAGCVSGKPTCRGNSVYRCTGNRWEEVVKCPGKCENGACLNVVPTARTTSAGCVNGASFCQGASLIRCVNNTFTSVVCQNGCSNSSCI